MAVRRSLAPENSNSKTLSFLQIFSLETEEEVWPHVRRLVEQGKINEQDDDGNTLLHHAIWCFKHPKVALYLIERGADYSKKNKKGETAAWIVWNYGKADYTHAIVRSLLSKGEKFEKKNQTGQTILHWAARGGLVDIAKALLDSGHNIDEKDNEDNTALDIASRIPMIHFLLTQGAHVEKENDGKEDDNEKRVIALRRQKFSEKYNEEWRLNNIRDYYFLLNFAWFTLWEALQSGEVNNQTLPFIAVVDYFNEQIRVQEDSDVANISVLLFSRCQPLWELLIEFETEQLPRVTSQDFKDLLSRYYVEAIQKSQESEEQKEDKSLVLFDCYWEPCKLPSLFACLQNPQNDITHLKISGSSWSEGSWQFFLENLSTLSLFSLELSDCQLDDDKLISLASVLAGMNSLKTCVLDRNQMSAEGFKRFISLIQHRDGLAISLCQQDENEFHVKAEETLAELKEQEVLLVDVTVVKKPKPHDEVSLVDDEEIVRKRLEFESFEDLNNNESRSVAGSSTGTTTENSPLSSVLELAPPPRPQVVEKFNNDAESQVKKRSYSIRNPLICSGVATVGLFASHSAASAVGTWVVFAKMCAVIPVWGWVILLGVLLAWLGRNIYENCKEDSAFTLSAVTAAHRYRPLN